MADKLAYMPETDWIAALDAVREKDGNPALMTSGEVASRILAIPTGGSGFDPAPYTKWVVQDLKCSPDDRQSLFFQPLGFDLVFVVFWAGTLMGPSSGEGIISSGSSWLYGSRRTEKGISCDFSGNRATQTKLNPYKGYPKTSIWVAPEGMVHGSGEKAPTAFSPDITYRCLFMGN